MAAGPPRSARASPRAAGRAAERRAGTRCGQGEEGSGAPGPPRAGSGQRGAGKCAGPLAPHCPLSLRGKTKCPWSPRGEGAAAAPPPPPLPRGPSLGSAAPLRGSGGGRGRGAARGAPLRCPPPPPWGSRSAGRSPSPPPSSPCSTEGLRAARCGEGLGAAAPRGDGDTGGGAADPSPLGAAARQLPTPLQQRRREVGGGGESWTASPGKC